jgi:hypothetical protein
MIPPWVALIRMGKYLAYYMFRWTTLRLLLQVKRVMLYSVLMLDVRGLMPIRIMGRRHIGDHLRVCDHAAASNCDEKRVRYGAPLQQITP